MFSFVKESESHTENKIESLSESETETETETEPETEPPFATVIAGVWEGSDSYITTIIFDEDGTLYYRELGNPKIATVKGSAGTWDTEDEQSVNIHLPFMGDGYELRATPDNQGGFILRCVNGQPWSEETIRKTDQKRAENDERAKTKLATMLEDGGYYVDNITFSRGETWNDGTCIRIESTDGYYIEATPERCEMKVRIKQYDSWNYSSDEKTLEGTFIIPFGTDCSYGGGGIWYDESTGQWFSSEPPTQKETFEWLYKDSIRSGGMTLEMGFSLSIRDGRIVVFGFFS